MGAIKLTQCTSKGSLIIILILSYVCVCVCIVYSGKNKEFSDVWIIIINNRFIYKIRRFIMRELGTNFLCDFFFYFSTNLSSTLPTSSEFQIYL